MRILVALALSLLLLVLFVTWWANVNHSVERFRTIPSSRGGSSRRKKDAAEAAAASNGGSAPPPAPPAQPPIQPQNLRTWKSGVGRALSG